MSDRRREIVVRLGDFAVARDKTLVALGLGSCVAVILYDSDRSVGSLAHVMLPSQSLSRESANPARAADTAIPHLIKLMQDQDADLRRIVARLVGGASMFDIVTPLDAIHIGKRNVLACRAGLDEAGIPLVGEAVGGRRSRSVWFDVGAGVVMVRALGSEPTSL